MKRNGALLRTMTMDLREYRMALVVGAVSGVLWFFVLAHLSLLAEGELIAAAAALPAVFVLGIALARRWFPGRMAHTLAKFLMVGVLNTGIDFFIFDTLIVLTGRAAGAPILVFKSISFAAALVNSYEFNRRWTFDAGASPARTRSEFSRFVGITVIGFLVNVGTTFAVATAFRPLFGMSQIRWDNVAAVIATALNLAWNFAGYRLFVFRTDGRTAGDGADLAAPSII